MMRLVTNTNGAMHSMRGEKLILWREMESTQTWERRLEVITQCLTWEL